jgi:pSer/pThr/pTyr-binding forkhead associated (FHA) protein
VPQDASGSARLDGPPPSAGTRLVTPRRVSSAPSTRVLAGALLREAAIGREPVAGPHLVRIDDPGRDVRAMLRDGLTIGRGERAELRLPLPEVSREHARIVAAPGGFAIADLGSKNGVAVNGLRVVAAPVPLRDGDVIALGAARLRVDGVGATVVAAHCAERSAEQAPDAARPGEGPGRRCALRAGRLAAAALLAAAAALAALAA